MLSFALPADAQVVGDTTRRNRDPANRAEERQDRPTDRQARQAKGRERARDSSRESNRRLRVDPEGWVRVAADYDGDGRIDAVDLIHVYDLQRARRASRERRQRPASAGRRDWSRRETIRGTITDFQPVTLYGVPEKHLVARVKTQEGRVAKVDLGPQSRLEPLDLRDGDRVVVEGVRGQINDRALLMAEHVEANGQSLEIARSSGMRRKRVRGELLSTESKQFRGYRDAHVVAQLRTQGGREVLVNLGPRSTIGDLDLQRGD